MDWNKFLQQLSVIAAFVWAFTGIFTQLNGFNGTGPEQLEWAAWRFAVAGFISLASIALFRALKLIDGRLERNESASQNLR